MRRFFPFNKNHCYFKHIDFISFDMATTKQFQELDFGKFYLIRYGVKKEFPPSCDKVIVVKRTEESKELLRALRFDKNYSFVAADYEFITDGVNYVENARILKPIDDFPEEFGPIIEKWRQFKNNIMDNFSSDQKMFIFDMYTNQELLKIADAFQVIKDKRGGFSTTSAIKNVMDAMNLMTKDERDHLFDAKTHSDDL